MNATTQRHDDRSNWSSPGASSASRCLWGVYGTLVNALKLFQ